jgi:cobalamin-dependent methionine synthase I
MKIIGEKINGTLAPVKKAIQERNASFIQDLAIAQAKAGAFWLDVNAGTIPEQEPEDLSWLVQTIQKVTDLALCLDTTNEVALFSALKYVKQPALINSISLEPERLESILPIACDNECEVIALAMDEKGIPTNVEDRCTVIEKLILRTRAVGIPDGKVYIDPLVTALATDTLSGVIAFDTIKIIRKEFPDLHFTMGLSNLSFGLPARSLINKTFLTLSMAAGLDCAIMDPLDNGLMEIVVAAELVLGKDEYCRQYMQAFRSGRIKNKGHD